MQTCHIHIQGQVQGVGFRPMVYQAALARGLNGWVLNGSDGVHIRLNGTLAAAESFAAFLHAHAPRLARITQMAVTQVEDHLFSCFEIVHSNTSASPSLLVSPDFALCPECRQELADPANRRAGYPFITCTRCGPRYSILNALPYDRERTSMAPFVQCPVCRAEYDDPIDRRYYSQTNSCPQCGIQLSWLDNSGSGEGPSSLDWAVAALEAGQLLAVKGIGGFLLMGDARSASVVRLLRQRKNRPSKPFAVMYPSMEQLEREVHLSLPAKALLEGPISPVVLAPVRDPHSCSCALEDIIPGLQHLGVLIPYAPLLEAIARRFPFPMLATSGNISQSPIIFGEQKAAEELLGIADFLLGHNRPIRTPQDDSVLRFSPLSQQPIWLRRARGLAPTLLLEAAKHWQTPALAMGADMKSAFSLLHAGNTYVSQYLGALDHWDTQQQFGEVLRYLMELLQAKPAAVLVDSHPGYFSTSSGHTLAADLGVPCMRYPHHLAHFAAILAEHDLFSQPDPILGVILDGTGLGTDGQI
ncbi:MAG: carbamoyltransferase HypF, partial [Haliscomenobacter sp.]